MATEDLVSNISLRLNTLEDKHEKLFSEFKECRRMLKMIYDQNKKIVYGKKRSA